jgi:curved DNA-binding protein CbpA
MDSVPDHYETLGLTSNATRQEIERAHQKLVKELRASQSSDAPEELAEVDAAYAVLHDPHQRTRYDMVLREAEAEEDKKYAKLDAEIQRTRHHGRKHIEGFSGLLDVVWWIFKLLK